METIKIVLLGSGGVGKSAITIQFIAGNFVEKYDPTIEDSYRKEHTVGGEAYTLDILDTAGQEEFSAMCDEYMRDGHVFVLVFSLTDKASFLELYNTHDKILKVTDAYEVPVILAGNKCDLAEERAVKDEDIRAMIDKFGFCKYLPVSAKTCTNVEEIFTQCVRLRRQDLEQEAAEEEETVPGKSRKPSLTAGVPQDRERTVKCGCSIM